MRRVIILGFAALTAYGFASMGCGSNNNGSSGNGGSKGSGGSKATGGASSGGASGSSSGGKSGTGGAASGGSSTASSTGGSTGSTESCGTKDGDFEEDTTFGNEGSTDPYKLNKWGTWGNDTQPSLTQTTDGPDGLDCGSGCAKLTIDFSDGTKSYAAGSFVEYFGSASDSVSNLLNETITVKIAVQVKQADGANTDVPISINLFGQDATTSSNGTDNLWVHDLGKASSLDVGSGWHTASFKVEDTKVPSWSPTRTVCGSGLHAMGITIQNNSNIDGSNGAVVTLYVQKVSVGKGGSSGGSGGSSGTSSGGASGGSSTVSSSGGNSGGSAGSGGDASGGASGGSSTASSTGGSTSSSGSCGTSDGTYKENTTFGTSDSTAPYNPNKWGTWGNATEPTLTQTTSGPSGLDCGSGCAKLAIDFSDGTKSYTGGSIVEYAGSATDSTFNLLNETVTAKIAVVVARASGASSDVPISINLFGQDTYVSSTGTDNSWSNDLGKASSLDAASGWHTVTYKVVDAKVPSWSPTRTVCASALHALGISIQSSAAIDSGNAAVVTLYVQSISVATP
jgi:hypothetical protein